VVVLAQVLDQVVTAREAIAILARAVRDRAILQAWVVDGTPVSLQVGGATEALAAVVAGPYLDGTTVVQLTWFPIFLSNWRLGETCLEVGSGSSGTGIDGSSWAGLEGSARRRIVSVASFHQRPLVSVG
jgi:hypothetical protein